MKTIAEIRRIRLEQLIEANQSIANLNERLGWSRTDPRLTRVKNSYVRAERGKPYQMGDAMAREIEEKLGLEEGHMDNLPLYEDPAVDARLKALCRVAEDLAPYQLDQLIKIGYTLSEPSNGTDDGK